MASTEANYSVTFKTPRNNLFTVRGNDAREFCANLDEAALSGAIGQVKHIEDTLAGQPRASAVAPRPAAVKAAETPAKKDDQELPSGMGNPPCDTCQGETKFDKEGISQKSGKAYRRYLCTANQLHRATFA